MTENDPNTTPPIEEAGPTPKTPFEFLNPLDGKKYTLPPFDKSLLFDAMLGHEDEIEPVPPASVFYSKKFTPKGRRDFIAEQQHRLTEFQVTTMLETFDAHLPDADDPAKAAIIANVNALDFAFLFKVYLEWVGESGVEEDTPGEG